MQVPIVLQDRLPSIGRIGPCKFPLSCKMIVSPPSSESALAERTWSCCNTPHNASCNLIPLKHLATPPQSNTMYCGFSLGKSTVCYLHQTHYPRPRAPVPTMRPWQHTDMRGHACVVSERARAAAGESRSSSHCRRVALMSTSSHCVVALHADVIVRIMSTLH